MKIKQIEALINDILTQCVNKGFTMKDVESLCCKLREKYRNSRQLQFDGASFEFVQPCISDSIMDCSSGDE